jgi:probable phosphoglycerate mutase
MTEATRVIALRHGETAWNVEQRIQGQLDVPLNDTGRWQAERLAQALADAGIDVIYSSDLQRAAATAAALATRTGLPVRHDSRLRERGFGRFEGRTFAEIDQRWPDEALRWRRRDPDFGPAGGETLTDFYQRSIDVFHRLAEQHPGQVVAIVSHGGLLDGLYRAATHQGLQAPRTWQVGNARINRVLFNGDGFTLVGWNDDQHLLEPPAPG